VAEKPRLLFCCRFGAARLELWGLDESSISKKAGIRMKEISGDGGRKPSRRNYQKSVGAWRKRKGEIGESAFLNKAVSLGFGVAKPWGDSDQYDFILDSGTRLWRVQVKSAYRYSKKGYYRIHTTGELELPYTPEQVDVLVAYISPVRVWYVIPVADIVRAACIDFRPNGRYKRSRFEKYREAWCWLACQTGKTAAQERCSDGGKCPMKESAS
jgi:PD-(D/E)XK nuclease superfamily protein